MTQTAATSKRSAGSATLRTHKGFRRATLTLTAWYALAVLLILALFNVIIYLMFVRQLHIEPEHDGVIELGLSEDRDNDGDTPPVKMPNAEIRRDLIRTQAMTSGVIFILVIAFAYAAARRALAPLEDAYERQRRFVADAAHEFRTPMAVLRAGAEVALSRDRSPDEYRAFIKDALDESVRLSELSDDLLALARGDAGHGAPFVRLDLAATVADASAHARSYVESKGLSFSVAVPLDGIFVDGAENDIRRALMNVIKNAADHTATGSVSVALEADGRTAAVAVADTGIGIANDDLARIFDRFYKADGSRSANGAGLGLSIVKSIMERHGGSVAVSSVPGQGTTVSLRFPRIG